MAAAHRRATRTRRAKFTFDDENRRGQAIDSIVSGGCILSGGVVRNSVLCARRARACGGARWKTAIVLDNCDIGRRAKIRRAILDKNVRVPEDTMIGYDLEQDRKLYHVTESGIVVVEKGTRSFVEVATMVV